MLHYFTQLPKNKYFSPEEMVTIAYYAFSPFYQYLDTTIKALDKKEDIKATWTKVKQDNLVELKIIGNLYEIPKTTKIKLLNIEKGVYSIEGDYEKDFDIPLIIWNNKQKIKIKLSEQNFISENRIKLNNIYEEIEKANWAGDDVFVKPTWITVKKNDKIEQENNQFNINSANNNIIEINGVLNNSEISINNKQVDFKIIETSKQPKNTKLIKEEKNRFIVYSEKSGNHNFKLQNLLNKENISFEDGTKFNAEHQENLTFKIKDKSIISKTVICDNVKFTIKELRSNDKNQYWIQLNEIDEEKDDIPGFSPLKYFFDDDISIKDNSGNEYSVAQGIESEYKLILREKNVKKYNSFTFPQGKKLQVRVNTYQLRKQLEAVLTLQNMPVSEHSNLIKLFEKREVVKWKDAENNYIEDDEWIVLTDENRSGKEEQREFVEKALSTPDFAILEGPPGSGKTTIILELICQLAKQGKRVLLCGSTHVAIDNVLERLKDKNKEDDKTLIEKYNILPVRIGDENRINEDIREFQINNLQSEHNISENLLLDAANLVCGTTIGILQHPKFKSRRSYNRKYPTFDEPIVPEFDYLIIDESSKTTFQEFLVPGLYAKKWILAGDVMQLSPFTDREQIVTNLETLPLKEGTLPKEYQRATFYLHKLLEITKYAKNKFILPVSSKVIKPLYTEIIKRKQNVIIGFFDAKTYNRLELTANDIIIIDKNILKENISKLPETHAV
ncbi:MAG: AAA domain-containing protein, partial [Bacteroidota bacterium]|nr:AAA domain-containing protein [Bacteroidota bacterium]